METRLFKEKAVPRVAVMGGVFDNVHSVDLGDPLAKVIDYLVMRGRRRPMLVFPCPSGQDVRERCRDVIGRVTDHGMTTFPHWVQGASYTEPGWAANCVEMLMRGSALNLPDALVINGRQPCA